jgi:polyisoprenyl-teichoic acid--peptidoglycan teichoic acid transferase
VDGNGRPIPDRGHGVPPRQSWSRRGERDPGLPGRQPAPTGRRLPPEPRPPVPPAPAVPRVATAPAPRTGRPRMEPPPGRPLRAGPVPTAPTAPVDPLDVDAYGPAPELDGRPAQRPVEPRRSVTRKPAGRRPPATSVPAKAAPTTAPAKSAAARSAAARAADRIPARRPPAGYPDDRAEDRADDTAASGSGRGLGHALLATAAATIAPGSGHLMIGHKRTGGLILGVFLLIVGTVVVVALNLGRTALLQNLLSTRNLVILIGVLVVGGLLWIATILRTYLLVRPKGLPVGPQALGALVVAALCLVVATPLGFSANLANTSRTFLDNLFPTSSGGTSAAEAIAKPRLNVLLVGSDAGPDRKGARTDTMMVASVDTKTGRSTLFALPRNIQRAEFPPDSPMAKKFPKGFHDNDNPLSGDYLLNAVYAYAHNFPDLAPSGPTADPGLNLLHQTVSYMLGVTLDYFVEVDMAGFQSIIDAVGGLTVDVGPNPLPIGGITPSGRHVKPDYYIPSGVQQLNGEQALAYARSRTDSTDYVRMGRQRCLLKNILDQKSPADILTNFQGIAAATTNSVSTNLPQDVLPALISLAGSSGSIKLESVSFDPSLPDPTGPDGKFSTANPDVGFMRQVVQDAVNGVAKPAPAAPKANAQTPATPKTKTPDAASDADAAAADAAEVAAGAPGDAGQPLASSAPTSLADTCT